MSDGKIPLDAEPTEVEESGEPGAVESEPAAFENRAARRARGKGSSVPPPAGKGQQAVGRGSVQGPRQWGNRRSG